MNRQIYHSFMFLIVGFVATLSVMASAQLVNGETRKPYTATVENAEDEARVGEPFFILLDLDPAAPPSGYYVSVLVDIIEKPEGTKPEILTGFPKISLIMPQAGFYTFAVRLSLVAKSSCGGINAEEIMAEEINIVVSDQ